MDNTKTVEKTKRAYRKTSETQKIIFDKAMALMSDKGFQGTTVRDICAEAKIPIGTFYNCYKSKVDILKTIYEDGDKYIHDAVANEFKGKSAIEKLHIFAYHYAQLNIRTGIDVMRVLFYPTNEWFADTRPMQVMLQQIIDEGKDSGEIRKELGTEEIVDYVFDIFRGVCYNWCIHGGDFDIAQRIESHIGLICDLIKA